MIDFEFIKYYYDDIINEFNITDLKSNITKFKYNN